ncbi:hypothetical protein [Gordonia tangerina]|uniref:Bacteriophage protein n=1 Tax=Gordonia tangerina TaxID=2911060 RepID=A0ABS9DMX1_9ACTN|nr:hypothetical protein [Gordonia tangerina]MCF3939937.1 hypothetical protein [Gordonia tangerina]
MSDPNTPEHVIAEAAETITDECVNRLREAGYEVVKLPKPGEFSPDGAHWNDYPFVVQKGTDIFVGAKFEYVYEINSTEARNVAASLLAAARAAEEQGDQS